MMHRPEVCYTVAGWTLIDRHVVELPVGDNRTLPCSLFAFSHGSLNTRKMIVLDYFIVNGEYSPDMSLLQRKAWTGYRTVNYAAQVQIAVSGNALTAESARKVVSDFAADSASSIVRLFENLEEDSGSKEPHQLARKD